jgi:hypothetical protein
MHEIANLRGSRNVGHILPLVFSNLASPLDGFLAIAYKSYDSVLYGNPVEIRSGPATVSVEDRSKYATGAPKRWEGSCRPTKRKPGDRPGSHRFAATSKEGR